MGVPFQTNWGGRKRGHFCIKKHRQVLGFWNSPRGQKWPKKTVYYYFIKRVLRGGTPRGVSRGATQGEVPGGTLPPKYGDGKGPKGRFGGHFDQKGGKRGPIGGTPGGQKGGFYPLYGSQKQGPKLPLAPLPPYIAYRGLIRT